MEIYVYPTFARNASKSSRTTSRTPFHETHVFLGCMGAAAYCNERKMRPQHTRNFPQHARNFPQHARNSQIHVLALQQQIFHPRKFAQRACFTQKIFTRRKKSRTEKTSKRMVQVRALIRIDPLYTLDISRAHTSDNKDKDHGKGP